MGNAELIELKTVGELDELMLKNPESTYLLFKHSLSCSISREVIREVSEIAGQVYLIVVQTARNVSEAVAQKTGVRHESPQALVMKGGECVYSVSHYDITAEDLRRRL